MNPDAVLILWDSDCSDVDEDDLNIKDKLILRSAYQNNLISVIDTLVKTGKKKQKKKQLLNDLIICLYRLSQIFCIHQQSSI